VRAAVLTISSSIARGEGEDVSGGALVELCEQAGLETTHEVVGDDREQIKIKLMRLADEQGVRFVFTTGGTGLTPDDVTPEATRAVLTREAPGFAEALRAEAVRIKPHGMLSRGVSGIAGGALIVNFPGSPRAVLELFGVIAPTLPHAVRTLRGDSRHGTRD
jgi:molybdopterin adenylyltransferase